MNVNFKVKTTLIYEFPYKKVKPTYAKASVGEEGTSYTRCLFLDAIPEPDFKYFSKANALYLSLNAQ